LNERKRIVNAVTPPPPASTKRSVKARYYQTAIDFRPTLRAQAEQKGRRLAAPQQASAHMPS
jgi:hypothetical protein